MTRRYIKINDVVKEINELCSGDIILILEELNVQDPFDNYVLTILLRIGVKVKNKDNLIYVTKSRLVDYIIVENKTQKVKRVRQVLRKEV